MVTTCECLGCNVGTDVSDFKLETYEPAKGDFGEISLETLMKDAHQNGRKKGIRHLNPQPS